MIVLSMFLPKFCRHSPRTRSHQNEVASASQAPWSCSLELMFQQLSQIGFGCEDAASVLHLPTLEETGGKANGPLGTVVPDT